MATGDWTAFEECRMALRRIVWKHHRDCIKGPKWNSLKPGASPQKGFACDAGKWRTEMQEAQALLKEWGYKVKPIGGAEGLLGQPLQASVQHLFDLILQNRPEGAPPSSGGDCI